MGERLIEIIVYLLQEFQQHQVNENYTDLSKELISLGYSENEINTAFAWIFNHMQNLSSNDTDGFQYKEGSNRVLHDVEKLVLQPDAYGYILQLRHLDLLSDYDIEVVIDRALSLGTPTITADDIKSIAATIVFGGDSNSAHDGFFYISGSNTVH